MGTSGAEAPPITTDAVRKRSLRAARRVVAEYGPSPGYSYALAQGSNSHDVNQRLRASARVAAEDERGLEKRWASLGISSGFGCAGFGLVNLGRQDLFQFLSADLDAVGIPQNS